MVRVKSRVDLVGDGNLHLRDCGRPLNVVGKKINVASNHGESNAPLIQTTSTSDLIDLCHRVRYSLAAV